MGISPLYIIAGPTAVGKGTLVSALANKHNDIWVSISATTRSPRKNEVHREHYFFLDKKKFFNDLGQNKFLEHAIVHGNYYGTYKQNVIEHQKKGKKVILEIDYFGAIIVKNKLKDKAVLIFLIPPNDETLVNRLKNRKTETNDEMKIRLETAKIEMEQAKQFDHIIMNDDFQKTLTSIEKIIYNTD